MFIDVQDMWGHLVCRFYDFIPRLKHKCDVRKLNKYDLEMLHLKNDKSYREEESQHTVWTREPDFIRSDDKALC